MNAREFDCLTVCAESVDEFCKGLGISRGMGYRLIREKKVRTVKLGSRRLVPLTERARLLSEATDAA